ncbi:PREDICTED: uncharacterized protein LOC105952496 [Erythranthe guttata]|uniref:uncharacterized protein LOC105952496 n=1 Tax=Erythranthe guttata TaxID=4155 RepID=UPI00064DB63E|nr:PREDICTED: uncharacterized protein LOC105952496 [Erythranthe guttata]|eukprot:XP_012831512.1 PREDICTED: uncharacterized protein LOC105952496 [Erythranthe guttata]
MLEERDRTGRLDWSDRDPPRKRFDLTPKTGIFKNPGQMSKNPVRPAKPGEPGNRSRSIDITQSVAEAIAIYIQPILATTIKLKKRPHGGSTPGRRYIRRDRKSRHNMIIKDYFKCEDSKYTADHFRRCFRMDVNLCTRILDEIEKNDEYFTKKVDAVKNQGLSPLQKMIAAIRMLAYGCSTDILDEYVQIGESTTIESLQHLCDSIIAIFEEECSRKPNEHDIKVLLKQGKARGFSGTHNDITVLDISPLFDNIVHGVDPLCKFKVDDNNYDMGYYLTDGIYPEYATLIQTISQPSSVKEKLFAKQQETVRKDVERAFGVLQSRWHIIKGPSRM